MHNFIYKKIKNEYIHFIDKKIIIENKILYILHFSEMERRELEYKFENLMKERNKW